MADFLKGLLGGAQKAASSASGAVEDGELSEAH